MKRQRPREVEYWPEAPELGRNAVLSPDWLVRTLDRGSHHDNGPG